MVSSLPWLHILLSRLYLYPAKWMYNCFSPSNKYLLHTSQENHNQDSVKIIHRVLLLPTNDHETYNSLLCCALFLIMQLIYRNRLDILKRQTNWILTLNNLMQKREFFTYTVADLCSLLNYSRMQLTRLFHSDLQTTPHKFLIDSKLRYAKNLLLTTDIKIIDIANRVGFANLSSFNLNFKKKYGVPPGSFRKNGKFTG